MWEERFSCRAAVVADIPQMQLIRWAVRENVLSDPALIRDEDYALHLHHLGGGCVCTEEEVVGGFAIVNLRSHSVWALFVDPDRERSGIGKRLLRILLDWYFAQTSHPIHLTTAPGTRAEAFYRMQGWTATGSRNGETVFELERLRWSERAGYI